MLKFFLLLAAALPACAQTINWTTQVKNKPFVDVRSYGVKGDGTTNDTVAFQAAIDAAGRGGVVYVPDMGSGGILINGSTLTLDEEGQSIHCASMDQRFKRTVSGAIITASAGSNEVINCGFIGDRTTGSIAISTSGVRGNFSNLRIDTMDGGVLMTGGFHNVFSYIWGRNIKSYVAKASDGVGPFFHNITYDTDPGVDITNEGGIVINTEGAYVYQNDILGTRYGVRVEAVDRDVTWTFIHHQISDQNFEAGILILNDSTYTLRGVFIDSSWMASSGMGTYTYGGVASTQGVGLLVHRSGSGALDWVNCDNCTMLNQRRENIKVLGTATDVTFNNNKLRSANQDADASIDSVYLETTGPVNFNGGEIWAAAVPYTHRSGIAAGPASGIININSVAFNTSEGDWSASTAIYNVAVTPGNVRNHGANLGEDDVAFGLASAATVSMPNRQYFIVNGTTPVNTLDPVWPGRKVYLSKTDGGTLNYTAAGNIQTAFTLTASEIAICEYVPSKWVCHK